MLSSHCKQSFILFVLTSKRCWIVELVQFLWRTIPQLSTLCVPGPRLTCVFTLCLVISHSSDIPSTETSQLPWRLSRTLSFIIITAWLWLQLHTTSSAQIIIILIIYTRQKGMSHIYENTWQYRGVMQWLYQMCLCFAGNTSSTRFDEKRVSYLCARLHII